ncbi:hypothetical protein FUAX_53230 (plasmid) [Fulvitalea axinellae]|uniref:Uncharacterized protein n=1 Tax=Fulvitalea axinellae TaxID=1182444 RepID=A0AAU9CLL4_9BACT|nr:hypothetical protein FUAX_53230 [Fulvitalea axinellae]
MFEDEGNLNMSPENTTMGNIKIWILMLFVTTVTACDGSLSPEEYVKWCSTPDSPLVQKKKTGNFELNLRWRPASLLVLEREGVEMDKGKFNTMVSEMSGFQHFRLGIRHLGKGFLDRKAMGDNAYQQMMYYLSYHMQNDIYMKTASDSLVTCQAFHFEGMHHNVGADKAFNLGFDLPDSLRVGASIIVKGKLFPSDSAVFEIKDIPLPQINF